MSSTNNEKQNVVADLPSSLFPRCWRTFSSTNTRISTDPILTSVPTSTTFGSDAPCLDDQTTTTAAEAAKEAECSMTLRQGLRLYPKAIMWSVFFSLTLIMEGYSTILVPNLFAQISFRRDFGHPLSDGGHEISAEWQTALTNGALGGQILGLFFAGWCSEKYGYRRTLLGGLALMTLFVFVPFFAAKKGFLVLGQCLMGVPWGVFQTISTVYAADVCPVALRAYLTTYVNGCWVLGQLFASVVLRALAGRADTWSYRIPFGLQWIFPLPIAVAVYFAPESPWWLVRQSRFEDATMSLRRLRTKPITDSDEAFESGLKGTLEAMKRTDEREKKAQSGTRYWDCFRGVDSRRTEIACMCWIIQTLCGSTFMGFSTYFYTQAGVSTKHAYTLSLGQFALGLIGVGISWVLMSHFGRRTLYLSGQILTFLAVLTVGILACIPQAYSTSPAAVRRSTSGTGLGTVNPNPTSINWAIAALLLVFTFIYDATIGPICYSLVSEIPSTRLRSKTIVLARNCYNLSGIVTNVVTPLMLNPTSWNWGAKTGFFWAVTSVVGVTWSWWRLPEPKGRSYAELDELFEKKIPARRFKGTDLINSRDKEEEEDGKLGV